MPSIIDSIEQTYTFVLDELSHPYTKDWLLIPSPLTLLVILVAYNIFCIKIGPMLMKNRPPYKVETIIKLYNIFQVIISLYIVYEGCLYLFSGRYNFQCEGPDETILSAEGKRVIRANEVYFITKIIELLDTVFFVLRKSDRQITFLHLYHHTFMPIISWICLKYVPGGQPVVVGTINSLVHVFMYSYYLLCALGPQYQKYLWWKKYLTVMQIVQFVIFFIHSFHTMFYTCSYPYAFKVLSLFEAITFIYLFSKFYWDTYIKQEMKIRNKYSLKNGNTRQPSQSIENSLSDKVTSNGNGNHVNEKTKNYSNGKSKESKYIYGQYEKISMNKLL